MGDFVGCNHHNYQYSHTSVENVTRSTNSSSVPYFTLSGAPTCHYKFPMPSYTTIQLVRRAQNVGNPKNTATAEEAVKLSGAGVADIVHDWSTFFAQLETRRPWHNKTAAAVWRGSLTGPRGGPRFQLVELAKQQQQQQSERAAVLDAAQAAGIMQPQAMADAVDE